MAAGTVDYQETRGDKDYLGMIANQIKDRVSEASDMARSERQFAEDKAEEGGTSLEEAGVGRGHFFARALGSKFGGDAVAKTRGRFAKSPSAGIDPAGTTASRFRGGFDYNVTNQILNRSGDDASSQNEMLTNSVIAGFRGVENATIQVSQALIKINETIGGLERTQMNMARAIMFQGYMMAMLQREQQRAAGRDSLRREERSIEGGGTNRIGGQSFGGAGGGRGMSNITPPPTRGGLDGGDIASAAISIGTSKKTLTTVPKVAQKIAKSSPAAAKAIKSTPVLRRLLPAGAELVTKGKGTAIAVRGAKTALQASKAPKVLANATKMITGSKPTQKLLQNANKLASSPGKLAKNIALQAKKVRSLRSLQGSMAGANKLLQQMDTLDDPFRVAKNMDEFGDFADRMAKLNSTDMVQEAFFNKKAYGAAMNTPDEMAEMYAKLVGGQIDGVKYSDKVARGITREILGPEKYKIFTKNADQSVKSASTFTHKMLKAPSIKAAQKTVAKTGAKTAAKAGARSIMKKIPVIAGIAGVAFGIQRAMEGDLFGAGLEIASGIMGATGVGGGLGLAIDGFLLGRDMGMLKTGADLFPTRKNESLMVGNNMFRFNEPGNEEYVSIRRHQPRDYKNGGMFNNTFSKEEYIKFGEGILTANKRNYGEFSRQNAAWLDKLDDPKNSSLFTINFGGDDNMDKGLLKQIRNNARDIANEINSMSTDVSTIAAMMPTIVNNTTNNYAGDAQGSSSDGSGGDFSDSGLDAYRLHYLGSLS